MEPGLFVLDPGEENESHRQALIAAVGSTPVAAVLISHAHPDHWPLAPSLARHWRAPLWAYGGTDAFSPDRRLEDGELIERQDFCLHVIHTPGHASDHLCFLLEGRGHFNGERGILFSGDHVMGWSTTILSPPGGSLSDYMCSLERLLPLDIEVAYPAHGAPVDEPKARIQELYEHRQERTRQALAGLGGGPATIPELVKTVYADTDPKLHLAAQRSLLAHIEALVEEGRIEIDSPGSEPMKVRYRLSDC